MPRPIIIDTDPGTDDAAAILLALAAAELEVLGLVTVAGNLPLAPEFNMQAAPFAAAVVFDSGAPITMIPLDLTHQVLSTPERIARLRALGNRCGQAAALLLEPPRAARRGQGKRPIYALHDPCVIAYLLAPELFEGVEANVAIEIQSPLTLGMTVV